MSYTIIRPKDRTEWLKDRSSGIGSSEVGTILGLNPFDTPYRLWRRKKGLDPAIQENFAMKAGHYLEDAVSKFYADETGVDIIKRSAIDWLCVNNDKPYLRVSPDRTFWLPDRPKSKQNKGILECKTTQMNVSEDDIPKYWFAQLQYQLGVAELEQGALAWLTQGRNFGYMNIAFDADFFAYIVEEVDRFWTDCIVGGQEPAPIDADDTLLRYPRSLSDKAIIADDELIEDCARLKALKEELAQKDKEKKTLESCIKLAFGDAEMLVSVERDAEGNPIGAPITLATWKTGKESQKFDEKRFQDEQPELWKEYQYTKPGSRLFLLK